MKYQYITLIDGEIARLEALQELSASHDEKIMLTGRLLGLMKAKEIIITTHNEW